MAKDAIKKGVTTTNSVNQSINSSYGKELMAAQQPIVITKKKEVIIWEISFSKPDQLKDFVNIRLKWELSNIEKLRHPAQVLEEPE